MSVTMPPKVYELARSMGATDRCIEAGPKAACQPCISAVMEAFDKYYRDVEQSRLRLTIYNESQQVQ